MKLILILFFSVFARSTLADEGMWLLNDFPNEKVQKSYGFKADQKWLDHTRLSSVRLAQGCSGSFVSPSGLVMTNHHCAHECIEQISTSGRDHIAKGFHASTLSDEVKCPELEVNQLTKITDVTDKMNRATSGKSGKAYSDAFKSTTAKLEKDCSGGNENLRCDVVTLFNGGKYHLYQYKRYQDVRLVFAPEFSVAFFGGDPDNFNFPRYDLDLSFVRVYEDNKPLKTDHYFKWSKAGAKENELTFVTGHPGRTSRLQTVAELDTKRNLALVSSIAYFSELRGLLTEYQKHGAEHKRTSNDKLFYIENSLKAIKGRYQALASPAFFRQKREEQEYLRKQVTSNPALAKEYGNAWNEIEKAQKQFRNIYASYIWLEQNRDFESKLFQVARTLVRAPTELEKPNEARLKEYTDSKIPELKQSLFSTAPIYDELEIAMLEFHLTKLRENLTADHPVVKKLFEKLSPKELAKSLVKDTELKSVAYREKLFNGGVKAIKESTDPMIQFVQAFDADARAIRKTYDDEIESVMKKNSELIAKAKFAAFGTGTYPDATFTLRISYGAVQGYVENGKTISPFTQMGGAYMRHTGYDPFKLPETWLENKSKLDLTTPMNFCTTNDIIGGNSGSPVINASAEIVGLVFDGNIQSLGGDYGFDASVNRTVAVNSSAILHALDKIYSAHRIVNEILRK